ncbi:MAG: hypothetical protein U1E76_27400 [Planctomycetota bacterium]
MTAAAPPHARPDRSVAAWLVFVALGTVMLAAALRGWHLIGGKDWNYFLGQTQAEVSTLLEYHQFPLWNPWLKGGQVSFAQPESMFMSPVTLLALLTGVLAAFKLVLLPLFVVGCAGTYELAGELGLRGLARLIAPLVFFGSSIFPLYLSGGLPNWLFGMSILPWLVLCYRRAQQRFGYVLLAALLYASTLYLGSVHHFVYFAILLFTCALGLALAQRSVRPFLALCAVQIVGVVLAAFRLLPLIEVFGEFPREIDATSRHLSPSMILKALLDHRLPDLWTAGGAIIRTEDTWIYWINCGSYIGPIAFLLALVGLLARPRHTWQLAIPLVVFAWLALGSGVRLSLWNLLHLLPVLSSMQAPERFMIFVTFSLSLIAAFGFAALASAIAALPHLRPAMKRWLAPSLVLLTLLPMLLVNAPIARTSFIVQPTAELVPQATFTQRRAREKPEQWGGELYEAVLANRGNPIGSSDLPSRFAVRAEGDPGYRGEVYLLGERGSVAASITPNVIAVRAQVTANDVLVVNQNYFPGWVAVGASETPLRPYEGLLSLPLAPGEHTLELRYRPASVPRGLTITVLGLLVAAGYAFARRKQAATRIARAELLALGAFTLLLLSIPAAARLGKDAVRPRADGGHAAVIVVDARGGSEARALDIQHAVDRAEPDDLILVRPGSYDGFRLDKGIALVAEPSGQVAIRSPITIEGVPLGQRARLVGFALVGSAEARVVVKDCKGTVFLQSLTIDPTAPGAAALGVTSSERVHLIGCHIGSARTIRAIAPIVLERTRLVSARSSIDAGTAAGDGAAAITASDALVLLHETTVKGGGGTSAAGPAVRLRKSRLLSSSSGGVTIAGGEQPVHAPAFALEQSSHALWSGTRVLDPQSSCDASSDARPIDPPLPRMTMSTNQMLGATLSIEVTGTPSARAFLLVGFSSMLVPVPGKNEWLQADITRPHAILPMHLNAAGKLILKRSIPRDLFELGHGAFGQIAVERHAGKRDYELSLLEGSLFEIGEQSP